MVITLDFYPDRPGSISTIGGKFFHQCFIPVLRLSCRKNICTKCDHLNYGICTICHHLKYGTCTICDHQKYGILDHVRPYEVRYMYYGQPHEVLYMYHTRPAEVHAPHRLFQPFRRFIPFSDKFRTFLHFLYVLEVSSKFGNFKTLTCSFRCETRMPLVSDHLSWFLGC